MAPWLANVLGIAVGITGILTVVYAVVADRVAVKFRPRRLCPACRYNMVATQGRRCSECGHTAKSERRLTRGRTLRRTAAVGVLLLFGAYGVRVIPGVQERGWPAAVPTVVLIAAMPQIHPDRFVPRDLTQYPWRERLFIDLDHSERVQSLWGWQERLLVRRCLRGDHKRPFLSNEWEYGYGRTLRDLAHRGDRDPLWLDNALGRFEFTLDTRVAWPTTTPVYVVATLESWFERDCEFRVVMSPRDERLEVIEFLHTRVAPLNLWVVFEPESWSGEIGTPPTEARSIIWDVQVLATPQWHTWKNRETVERHVRTFTYEMPITIKGCIEDHVKVVDNPEIGEALRTWLVPNMEVNDDEVFDSSWSRDDCRQSLELVDFYDDHGEPPDSLAGITLGVEVELLRDGAVIRSGTTWFAFDQQADEHEGEVLTEMIWRGEFQVRLGTPCLRPDDVSGEMTVRLRGLPHIGLRDFKATAVWSGEVTLPLSVHLLDL